MHTSAMKTELVGYYRDLEKSDRSVLWHGSEAPGSLMLTDKGSDNGRFCAMLGGLGWAVPVILPEPYPRDRLAGWMLTGSGAQSLTELLELCSDPETLQRRRDREAARAPEERKNG